MVDNFKNVIVKIDDTMIEQWVRDLVIVKTYIGLKFQEAVLKKVSSILGLDYWHSSSEEESKGIDGYIGAIPVSIKPETYKAKQGLQEKIEAKIIYYEKKKDGLVIDFQELISTN